MPGLCGIHVRTRRQGRTQSGLCCFRLRLKQGLTGLTHLPIRMCAASVAHNGWHTLTIHDILTTSVFDQVHLQMDGVIRTRAALVLRQHVSGGLPSACRGGLLLYGRII